VKTAISVPDPTFDRVTRRAADLGMSRSEFFARAAEHYLDELDARSLSHHIDHALEHLVAPDESSADAVSVGHHLLSVVDDDW
jgi:metal-responsive CopG/Arc/MetJ family transcriptional regulator